ncbi:flagellar hook-associated protein FlgL [uncultured Sphingomonas sp.]|uniref:flagellar hook-associated protein FlgL n=1 Tax=uncultured Sphingomonas sp. TaxID=158754 RepID=UPI00261B7B82|nr:flagellar hook-associated protein FlgL [uncultured Sphingomonas sp.]
MSVSFAASGFYGRSAASMNALTQRAEALQTQVSTGKKLQAPSDDAVAYQRLQGLRTAGANDAAFGANVKIAQSVLAQADSTLGSIGDQLQKANELAVQAGNGTLSDDAKKAIATQLKDVLSSIVGLANAKDARGAPLFGGSEALAAGQAETPAVTQLASGALAFAAGQPSAIPIGDGQSVQPSVAARDVLTVKGADGKAGRDLGEVLTAMIATLEAGGTLSSDDTADLATVTAQNTQAQASVGARAVRVDLQAAYFTQVSTDREAARSDMEDVDVTTAITELQKTMTILSATQASFSKLSQLSLFDYIR